MIACVCTLDPLRDSTGLSSLYPWYNPLANVILATETTCSQYIYEPIDWWFTKDSSSETAIGRLASTFASFVTESATQETRGPKLSAGTTKAARTISAFLNPSAFSPYPWCKPIVHCSNLYYRIVYNAHHRLCASKIETRALITHQASIYHVESYMSPVFVGNSI